MEGDLNRLIQSIDLRVVMKAWNAISYEIMTGEMEPIIDRQDFLMITAQRQEDRTRKRRELGEAVKIRPGRPKRRRE